MYSNLAEPIPLLAPIDLREEQPHGRYSNMGKRFSYKDAVELGVVRDNQTYSFEKPLYAGLINTFPCHHVIGDAMHGGSASSGIGKPGSSS